jgi:hypothetical protein
MMTGMFRYVVLPPEVNLGTIYELHAVAVGRVSRKIQAEPECRGFERNVM